RCQRLDHIDSQHPRSRASQEDVGADTDVGQRARVSTLSIASLVGLHIAFATFVDDAAGIHDVNVFAFDAQMHDEIQASDSGGAGARAHQLDVFHLLAHDLQAVQDGRRGDNRRTVLIVVEDRNLHALTQLLFNVEAFGRLDVFEIYAA